MEYVITIYKNLNGKPIPISIIKWTGIFHRNPRSFAKKHGGDFMEIQTLEDYLDLVEEY